MTNRARGLGIALSGIGLAVLLSFGAAAVGMIGELRQAQAEHLQHPSNAAQDLRLFIETVRLGFLVAGAIAGGLITLNGALWIALGAVVRRLDDERPSPRSR